MDRTIFVCTLHSRTIILFQYFQVANSSLEVNFLVVFKLKLFRYYLKGSTFSLMCALDPKKLFTDRCRWQNICPSLMRLVNNCVESIYKMQKPKTKVSAICNSR